MIDYLILGSGLSALSFGALMSKSGKKVKLIEAHEYPGGYGHTFPQAKDQYRFNAQLHYVWNCGEGQPVHNILKKLGLHEEVTFQKYNVDGFDKMKMPGFDLRIPNDYSLLGDRLVDLLPGDKDKILSFLGLVQGIGEAITKYEPLNGFMSNARNIKGLYLLAKYRKATLQDVFDQFKVPLPAQTLLGLQWPDFMLPPSQLSFIAWVGLFDGYQRGAFYPTRHFEHVVDSFVKIIKENGGEILYENKVIDFILEGDQVKGVITEEVNNPSVKQEYFAKDVVCNIDPKMASEMIGVEKFSSKVRNKLNYTYSPSSWISYCAVEGIDLKDYGFDNCNFFHTTENDLNKIFHRMYELGDYKKPSFAMTSPSLHGPDSTNCPEGQQMIEFLTVGHYRRFLDLKLSNPRAYNNKKMEIFNSILDEVEEHYIPNLRKHLVFKISGSPTTSERYCGSPMGNSYGSNLTPENMGLNRLDYGTSLKNFYFCNASSGFPGFAGTVGTGARLYDKLTGDTAFTGK
jgi:phytoene dehydrogenase-like protein